MAAEEIRSVVYMYVYVELCMSLSCLCSQMPPLLTRSCLYLTVSTLSESSFTEELLVHGDLHYCVVTVSRAALLLVGMAGLVTVTVR